MHYTHHRPRGLPGHKAQWLPFRTHASAATNLGATVWWALLEAKEAGGAAVVDIEVVAVSLLTLLIAVALASLVGHGLGQSHHLLRAQTHGGVGMERGAVEDGDGSSVGIQVALQRIGCGRSREGLAVVVVAATILSELDDVLQDCIAITLIAHGIANLQEQVPGCHGSGQREVTIPALEDDLHGSPAATYGGVLVTLKRGREKGERRAGREMV